MRVASPTCMLCVPRNPLLVFCAVLFILLWEAATGSIAAAATAPSSQSPTASQILDAVQGKSSVIANGRAQVEMTVEKGGMSRTNKVNFYRTDDGHGTVKQLVEFLSPADVRGTKFLSISQPNAEDQMWLYLPSLGKERRIAGTAAKGKFMGTDFTFEEISATTSTWKDYGSERLTDTAFAGRQCYVLKLTPKASDAAYGSVVMCVWKDAYLPLKIQFYSRSGGLQKVMTFSDLEKASSGKWRPKTIVLEDSSSASVTTVRVIEMEDTPASQDVFTLRYLRAKG